MSIIDPPLEETIRVEDQFEWHRMTKMTGQGRAVMGNSINTHTHTHMGAGLESGAGTETGTGSRVGTGT